MRYAKQKDRFRCGPYALLNSLKWAGHKYSERKHKKYLSILTGCAKGTYPNGMWKGLVRLNTNAKFKSIQYIETTKTIKKLDKHLRNGGSAILAIGFYRRKEKRWRSHWIFIEKIFQTRYKVVNYSARSTVSLVKHSRLRKEIFDYSKKFNTFSPCWLLERWQ